MQTGLQILPFLLIFVYLALTVMFIVLAFRLVQAHERLAKAMEDVAANQRGDSSARKL